MKKKKIETLGIFGDSYAVDYHGHRIQDPDQKYVDKAWVNMIKNDYTVTNYAKSGSSIYYSYKLFMENHMKHDNIMFIVSGHASHRGCVTRMTIMMVVPCNCMVDTNKAHS